MVKLTVQQVRENYYGYERYRGHIIPFFDEQNCLAPGMRDDDHAVSLQEAKRRIDAEIEENTEFAQ